MLCSLFIFLSLPAKSGYLLSFPRSISVPRHQNRILCERDNCNLLQKPLSSSQKPNAFLPSFVSPQFLSFSDVVFFTTSFAIYLSVSFAMRLNKYSFILTSFGWFVGFYGCRYCCLRDGLLGDREGEQSATKTKRKRQKIQKYHKRT